MKRDIAAGENSGPLARELTEAHAKFALIAGSLLNDHDIVLFYPERERERKILACGLGCLCWVIIPTSSNMWLSTSLLELENSLGGCIVC